MFEEIKIKHSGELKTVSVQKQIIKVDHFSNHRYLFDLVISKSNSNNSPELEQLILIEFHLILSVNGQADEFIFKYNIVLERNCNAFFTRQDEISESYRKFIIRLTSFSEFETSENIDLLKTAIALIESKNRKVKEIASEQFFTFDITNLMESTPQDNYEFGLFILDHYPTIEKYYNIESDNIKKIILNSKFPELNTYVIKLLPSPIIDLYDRPFPSLNEWHKFRDRYKDFYSSKKTTAFIQGTPNELELKLNDAEELRRIIMEHNKQKLKSQKSNVPNDIHDDIDWTYWNDNLDSDQQSEEYWNQF